jgi:hypothetical protein
VELSFTNRKSISKLLLIIFFQWVGSNRLVSLKKGTIKTVFISFSFHFYMVYIKKSKIPGQKL